jgi:hypothetical protein
MDTFSPKRTLLDKDSGIWISIVENNQMPQKVHCTTHNLYTY